MNAVLYLSLGLLCCITATGKIPEVVDSTIDSTIDSDYDSTTKQVYVMYVRI